MLRPRLLEAWEIICLASLSYLMTILAKFRADWARYWACRRSLSFMAMLKVTLASKANSTTRAESSMREESTRSRATPLWLFRRDARPWAPTLPFNLESHRLSKELYLRNGGKGDGLLPVGGKNLDLNPDRPGKAVGIFQLGGVPALHPFFFVGVIIFEVQLLDALDQDFGLPSLFGLVVQILRIPAHEELHPPLLLGVLHKIAH